VRFWLKIIIFFLQQLLFMNKTLIVHQESSTASDFVVMQATAGPLPRADAAATQPQGRPGKHFVASTHERSMQEVEMGGVGAERPF
jgi:hypothetical protein